MERLYSCKVFSVTSNKKFGLVSFINKPLKKRNFR